MLKRPLIAGAVLCALAAGSFASHSEAASRTTDTPWALQQALDKGVAAAETPRAPGTSDAYAPAQGCFALRSVASGKLVTRSGSGFAATGTKGEPFRFQAFDLGKYLLLGTKRDFLAGADKPLPTQEAKKLAAGYLHGYADNWEDGLAEPVDSALDTSVSGVETATAPVVGVSRSNLVTAAAEPSSAAEWVLRKVGSAFVFQMAYDDGDEAATGPLNPPIAATLLSTAVGDLAVRPGAFTTKTAQFTLEAAKGCQSFVDAPTGVQGPVRRGATGFEQTKGYLDAHLHLMAVEFLGGRMHCGRPWHPYGIEHALVDCPDHSSTAGYGSLVEDFVSGRTPGSGHDTAGYPSFPFWPKHDSLTHEQVYYQWLERAWRGGLRMMTDLLVDNGQLCEAYPLKKNTCNEMLTVKLEAQRSREFERFIDAQSGGPGRGWFRIVTDPLQARRVINAGKLAVVLGIEVSRPLDCRELQGQPTCTEADIDKRLTEVWNLGVRQMEMTNKFDNALTGVTGDGGATGILVGGVGNLAETGHIWKMGTCQAPFGKVQNDHTQMNVVDDGHAEPARDGIFAAVLEVTGRSGVAPLYPAGPHCNSIGLSKLGEAFLAGMVKRGMMFDPDHMSAIARQKSLDILAKQGYSGVVSSHTWADDANYYQVLKMGGVVTPHAGGSTGFLGKWDKLRKHADPRFFYGVGYGSDISGFSAQGGGRNPAKGKGVTYPYTGFGGTTIAKPTTGTRTWDVNTDGVAQYGLYPDWVQDVRVQAGASGDVFQRDIEAGPEAYLQSWERAVGIAGDACRPDVRDLTSGDLKRVKRGMTPEQVLTTLGQPHTRSGSEFTFCTTSGTKTVRFTKAGTTA